MMIALAWAALVIAAVPACMFLLNLRRFRPPLDLRAPVPGISVLIPARNEEANIEAAVRSVLASEGVEIELLVLDDHSTDRTAEIVDSIARTEGRLSMLHAPPLPSGWCGKQYACSVLSSHAWFDVLCFVDADVRLAPDALRRMAGALARPGLGLVSGFPREITESFAEGLLIPLIHFILLGFLPMGRMRKTVKPAYAAGCGQLMMVRRDAYLRAGGHAAIRSSLHDGLNLPKRIRAAGYRTDVFDATQLAECRMYRGAREVWSGLAKNAVEGMAAPSRILPFTCLLVAGQVLPFALLFTGHPRVTAIAFAAAVLALTPRLIAANRFRQPIIGALLHPLGVFVLLAIQWYALARSLSGQPAVWKGRAYARV